MLSRFKYHWQPAPILIVLANLMINRYARSKDEWDDEQKKNEMSAPEARYLVARSAKEPMDVKGFLLFRMLHEETMDDDVMAQAAYW